MDLDAKVKQVQERIQRRIVGALRASTNPKNDPDVQACMKAYVDVVCRRRPEFMSAALKCEAYSHVMFGEAEPKSLLSYVQKDAVESLIVQTPARWEFKHCDVFGDVPDVCCCVDRYDACTGFMGVHPLEPRDPWNGINIMMRHKETSPWYQRLKRRRELKHQLGSQYRSLVSKARENTKEWFLTQWDTPPIPKEEMHKIVYNQNAVRLGRAKPQIGYAQKPDDTRPNRLIVCMTDEELLKRTGYTPEEFWRECKKPNTVKPHFPQFELSFES